jgi:hypothetical protein
LFAKLANNVRIMYGSSLAIAIAAAESEMSCHRPKHLVEVKP